MIHTLDKERLDDLIKVLETARDLGFNSLSSPVSILLEAGIDVMLLLRKSFIEGTFKAKPGVNPSLIFSETEQDALGNPKQIRITHKDDKFAWDPELSEIFTQLTSFLVLVKNQDPTAKKFFHGISAKGHSRQPSMETSKQSQETQIGFNLANLAKINYHRRQRKRSFSKYHPTKGDKKEKKLHQPN